MTSLAWLLLVALAWAAPERTTAYYLESAPSAERAEAAAVVRRAAVEGWRAQVVRRHRHGVGWEYVALVDGFEASDLAADAARRLADLTGRPVVVYATDGELAQPVDARGPSEARETADPGDVDAVVRRAVRAQGSGAAARLAAADAVLLKFRRTLPDGRRYRHVYARKGDTVYVEVLPEGEGTPSRTWLVGERAWLVVGSAPATEQDATRTAEVLRSFAPESVLAFPLAFPDAVEARPDLRQLVLAGTAEVAGRLCHVLGYEGDRLSGPVMIAVGTEDHLVHRVAFGSGGSDRVQELEDYRELAGGGLLPWRVRTWLGGAPLDDVEILELDLRPDLPDEWTHPPAR